MPATRFDRRYLLRGLAGSGLALALTSRLPAARAADDDDEELKLADVPAAIRAAADKAVTGAKWTAAYRYKEEGETFYDLEGTDSKKRAVTVVLTAAGKVEEVETEIKPAEAPEVVREALKAKYPRFKVKTAYEISQDGKVESYDFEGRRPKDKDDIIISVSADGKTVEIDDDAS
jgi:hypothetical protein